MDLNGKLIVAARRGYTKKIERLIQEGADIEAKDKYGWTALLLAASNGHIDVIEFLIEKGADVNAKNRCGETALVYAAMNGRTKMAELLLEHGADIEAREVGGWTAFMKATTNAHKKIAELLLIGKRVDVVYAFVSGYGYTRRTIDKMVKEKPELFTEIQRIMINLFSNPEKIPQDKKKEVIEVLREFQKKGSITKEESLKLFRNLQKIWNEQTELRIEKRIRKPEKGGSKGKLNRMVN